MVYCLITWTPKVCNNNSPKPLTQKLFCLHAFGLQVSHIGLSGPRLSPYFRDPSQRLIPGPQKYEKQRPVGRCLEVLGRSSGHFAGSHKMLLLPKGPCTSRTGTLGSIIIGDDDDDYSYYDYLYYYCYCY